MALYTDLPTPDDLVRLLSTRGDGCVSIYIPTTPVTPETEASRIEFKNESAEAGRQLVEAAVPKHTVEAIAESLESLHDDDSFWARQSHSLAVFTNGEETRTFRLPNRLVAMVEVSDRFHVKPLLRAITFPQSALVLALSQNGARLIEVAPDAPPTEMNVPDMPSDAANAAGKASIGDRSAERRIQGSEGKKVRLRQYARRVEEALRPILSGRKTPLILAATEPLESIFRGTNTYPYLAAKVIEGGPDDATNAQLADRSRGILDDIYASDLAELQALFAERAAHGSASDEVTTIARAATFGAVETAFVDIDETAPGFIDEESGEVTLEETDNGENYGVIDEIARRVLLRSGRVLAVRGDDVPGDGPVAAIMRYPV